MTVKPEKLVIGTRGSPLALWQANKVRDELAKISPETELELRIINTSGDWRPQDGEVRLKECDGGKGQFAKEIEAALLAGEIDMAVHSMKDMETTQPNGLCIPFMLPRADARDVFLSNISQNIYDLPAGSVVGTASMRRGSFLLNLRPDLKIVPFRGNVHTRIEKLRAGAVDATLLACAGLTRLGLMHEAASVIDVETMLPAVAQGAVGVEIRSADMDKLAFISQISCGKTVICVECERAVLRELDGSCHTPVGVYAVLEDGEIFVRVRVVSPDGGFSYADEARGRVSGIDDAKALGCALGQRVKPHIPDGIL